MKSLKLTPNELLLIRRYLIWCYKTTKEDLDRVDRYYTQIKADKFILENLRTSAEYKKRKDYKKLVEDFEQYMKTKKANVDQKKFGDVLKGEVSVEYLYLKQRFAAIESAILHFLGKKDLQDITLLYENEMTQRILQAREHA